MFNRLETYITGTCPIKQSEAACKLWLGVVRREMIFNA